MAVTRYSLDGGQIWQTYTAPFDITADGVYNLLARSWDNAGNDEGPPDYEYIQIDQTPPVVTETVIPILIDRVGRRGTMVDVDYSGTAEDATSGVWFITNTVLIDEYGELDQDLGSAISGTVSLEAWHAGNDHDGRIYTFRLTAYDRTGNSASVEAITLIIK